MMRNIQGNMSDLDKLNQQLASGKQFQRPSDAPIKVTNSMQFSSMLEDNNQYQRNIEQARNWISFSENALADMNDVLQTTRELALQAANSTNNEEDVDKIALVVKELRNELVSIANSKLGDNYIFSGQATNKKPIVFDDTQALGDKVSYQGDFNKISRGINPSIEMDININGQYAFKGAIEDLNKLIDNMENYDQEAISNTDLANLDGVINNTLAYRAELGAKINRLDLTESRLEDDNLSIQKLKSKNEDIDIAETIMNLKMKENVYQASLASGARIIQPSLMDFLR